MVHIPDNDFHVARDVFIGNICKEEFCIPIVTNREAFAFLRRIGISFRHQVFTDRCLRCKGDISRCERACCHFNKNCCKVRGQKRKKVHRLGITKPCIKLNHLWPVCRIHELTIEEPDIGKAICIQCRNDLLHNGKCTGFVCIGDKREGVIFHGV